MHWYWHDLSWDISCPFLQICTRTWFHRILYMHLYWQDLAWDCFTSYFPNLYQSYGPWFKPKVFSAQYLENKWTEFHQILNMHWYWQHLSWDQYTSFSAIFYQSYGTWFTPKFCFCLISWEQTDRISSNFKYAFILTQYSLLQSYVPLLMSEFVPAQYL